MTVVDESDSIGPQGEEDKIVRLEAKVAEMRRRFERLERALRQKVLTVEAKDGHVRVRINGMEEIVELVIAPDALRDPHIYGLGASVVATVGIARARARRLREAAKAKVFADLEGAGAPPAPLTQEV
ncbi:hypothetical protein GCM10010191_34000 [Actinomadura vinacea]|uniref:YbaB/EbfC family DNA-binding protein n=1 Tax=Actinomadura vinacea TaxID=115336 RepID=A0ABN3J1N4_9ACTN